MVETIMSVAIITALFGGAAALLKVVFGGNTTRKEQYAHEEALIKLMQNQNSNSEKLIESVDNLRNEVVDLKTEMVQFNERLVKLENERH